MTIKVTYNVTDVYMSQSVSPVYINVSYSDGGASGGGVWGSITGTLSNQTDLQTALDAKLDESTIDGGAEGQILSKASATDFDFAWINNYAKYLATNVRNQTGSTIGAFQVVYISGATGNKPLISLADADTEATSSKTYGVTATSIANNGTGDVVTAGELSGIDTSAFNEGDLLWLSTTAGGVVTSPPAEPAHAVFIGYVVRSHPTLGVIDVSIANGYELNELHGVQITTPTDNQGLFYNATSTLWENKSITTALGYTPVPTTRNITINGVTYDLSADRTWTIAAGISGSGAAGQVTYWTGASAVSGSSLFTWDNTNRTLLLSGAQIYQNINQTNTTLDSAFTFLENNVIKGGIQYLGSAFSVVNRRELIEITGRAGISFRTTTEFARFSNVGNLLLNSTSDNGQRLQVYGDTLLRGSGATSATTALTVQNSASATMMSISNDAVNTTLNISGSTYSIFQANQTTANRSAYFGSVGTSVEFGSGTAITNYTFISGSGYGLFKINTTPFNVTGGDVVEIPRINTNFAPTSGSANLTLLHMRPTINQTGGANGITRGLYVNPTLTAAADWRSIEWSNNTGWGLYGAGTANNYLAGSLGIGTSTNLAGINLYVNKNIVNRAGGNGFGIANEAIVQSIVTNLAASFASYITTQNTNFSLTNIRHYSTESATTFPNVTAGGSVTNQYGYWADSSLTGATNNFGFYGNIASGTGRWNLYMAGTANNYVAGNFSVGTTSVTNWLNIAASTTAKAHINLAAGSTPTAPANGDIWFDGTDIKMRIGGVTKTFTLV